MFGFCLFIKLSSIRVMAASTHYQWVLCSFTKGFASKPNLRFYSFLIPEFYPLNCITPTLKNWCACSSVAMVYLVLVIIPGYAMVLVSSPL